MRFIKIVTFLLFIYTSASAQFYVTGDDPGKLKWKYIDTESYRVIYPQGADSLAKVYSRKLEKYKIPISRTSGYMTGDGDGKIMPVVIHAYNDANGSVAWAPRRMDLFTIPSAYDPEPMPWSTMLSIHESRHVTQMQFGQTRKLKPLKWIIGEGWNIISFLLYPGLTVSEGDAVVMETALTPSGRGRTADFLNYYWVAFDHGDFRGWFKWRYVSQLRYSPTYYALGYMTVGGYRYMYNHPHFISDGLHLAAERPLKAGCMEYIGRQLTGRNWNGGWQMICDTMYGIWKADADKRAPYIPSERVLPESKRYTDYSDLVVIGNDLYTIKKGHVHTPSLVKVDSTGKEYHISSFAHTTSTPRWDKNSGNLYWSETLPDKRWTLKSDSKIRYIKDGKRIKRTFRNKELLYNPSYAKSHYTFTVEYNTDGKSKVSVLNIENGNKLFSLAAPDSVQLVETAWIGDDIYATGISENGYSIYKTPIPTDVFSNSNTVSWDNILGPQPVMIKDFKSYGEELIFTCDRTGVNELYHFNPSTSSLYQKTSTRYGASDFEYSSDGQTLYYSSQTMMGKHIFRTPADSLLDRKVRFDSLYKYPIAEKMKDQETEVAKQDGYAASVTIQENDVKTAEPKPYRKLTHLLNLHTWFPAYVSVDNIMNNLSFDPLWHVLSLGISGVTQNHLATAIGEAGYSAHRDPYNTAKWRHSGHIKFTYSGLYPIFQFSFDINDRGARQYNNYTDISTGSVYMVDSRELSTPFISGKASMYIPFSFSSGGWNKGVIPKVSYTITNDIFNTGTVLMERGGKGGLSANNDAFAGYKEGKKTIRQYLSGSVRAYTMKSIANSQVYPRWGIGAEIGVSSGLESYKVFSPMGYLYSYGYLPGIMRTHGIKLSAMWQAKLRDASTFSQQLVNILPRGLSNNSSLGSYLSLYNKNLVKVTADYAIPIYIGDITIGGYWLAIKRLVAYPHFDYTFIGNKGLWSAGLNLTADLHAIFTIEWPCSFGVSFSWNGGSAWNQLADNIEMNRWFVGPVFNVSF